VKLSALEIATLQVLRAGPIDGSDLNTRFDGAHAANVLQKKGYADFKSGMWQITPAGRAACPLRNKHLETMMSTRLDALALIKKQPGITGGELDVAMGVTGVCAYIKHEIARSEVITMPVPDGRGRMFYMAEDAPKDTAKVEPSRVRAPELQTKAVENMADLATTLLEAPLDAPVIDIDKVYESLSIPKPTPIAPKVAEQATKPFRVAYTNDGCLMLFGLNDYGMPIELNPAQTKDVVEFLSEQVMPIVGAME